MPDPRVVNTTFAPRECVVCGTQFQPIYHQNRCCSHKCSALNSHRKKQASSLQWQKKQKIVVVPKPKSYRSPISDSEQLALNQSIDSRYRVEMTCRRIAPDDPDFQAILQQITPIEKI